MIGVLGCGRMGVALARAAAGAGVPVLAGTGSPERARVRLTGVAEVTVTDHVTVLARATTVILALPYAVAVALLCAPGTPPGDGRVLIDATNSVFGDRGDPSRSNGAALAAGLPHWRVVKAFNTVSAGMMAHPTLSGRPVTLPIAGDDAEARAEVAALAGRLGFHPAEVGPIARAATLEAVAGLLHHVGVYQGLGGCVGLQVVGLDERAALP